MKENNLERLLACQNPLKKHTDWWKADIKSRYNNFSDSKCQKLMANQKLSLKHKSSVSMCEY